MKILLQMPHSLQVSYVMHTMREQHENSNDGGRECTKESIKYLLLDESLVEASKGKDGGLFVLGKHLPKELVTKK